MSVSERVNQYLTANNIPFNTISHSPSHSSVQTAIASRLPLHSIAKAIILKDAVDNYLMAVVPASNRVKVKQVGAVTQSSLKMASEQEITQYFTDCQKGAIPPFGQAYDMTTVWDDSLGQESDIYLEAGDHQTLIHLSQKAFQQVVKDARHESFCTLPAKK